MGSTDSASVAVGPDQPTSLPLGRLLAFTAAGFLAIMTENMPAGLLPGIGNGLAVSEAKAGQLVTLYALGSVVAAIPVIAATRGWNRRPLFLLAIAGLFLFNSLTAISASYGLTLVARFVAGMSAGVVWGLVAGYARRLAPAHLQGRAMAVVGIGQPIALSIGVPLGAWLGGLFDWRTVFWIMSVAAAILLLWVRLGVPDFAGQAREQRMPIRRVLALPGVAPILSVLFTWILAHNILYTYVAPYLAALGSGLRVELALLVFGFAAVVGVVVTGAVVDSRLRNATVATLVIFAAAAFLLALPHGSSVATLAGIALWGLSFGGAPTLLQTALADAAGGQADVAQSVLVTVFNAAVAGGGIAGGLLIDGAAATVLPWATLPLTVVALTTVVATRRTAFVDSRKLRAGP